LRKYISQRQLKHVIQLMHAEDVIEIDRQYINGTKPRGYRLTMRYRTQAAQLIEAEEKVASKLQARKANQCRPITQVERHLARYLHELTLCTEYATRVLNTLPQSTCLSQTIAVDKLARGDFFFVPDNYGRIHTNLTNLHKQLRACVRYEERTLVNIDIVNAQPFFLACAIDNIVNIRVTMQRERKESYPYGGTLDVLNAKRFCDIACQGMFYEELMALGRIRTREAAKKVFFRGLFGDASRPYMAESVAILRQVFPEVVSVAQWLKKDDYRELARSLQRAESEFVIGTVCKHLMESHPNVPVWTIHDSIVTTPEHVGLVKDMMEGLARERFGLIPSLKVDRIAPAASGLNGSSMDGPAAPAFNEQL
jgi:hypothetical protein